MTFEVPDLDDRRFQDIVDEARRLIPVLCPEWTALDETDPGVAIIELFAWMSEMVIYRLNQVPDAFYTRMLNLMGAELYPPRAARAELTFWSAPGFSQPSRVTAGTEVATNGDDPIVFTTLEDAVIEPTELLIVITASAAGSHRDVTDELADGTGFACFDPLEPGAAVYLGFERSLAGHVVRVDLTMPTNTELDVVGPPPIVWECGQGEGWAPASVLEDTTDGLGSSGSVRLQLPHQHEPLTLSGWRAYWLRIRLTPSTWESGWYPASPRVEAIDVATVGVTVTAEHSTTMLGEVVGISDGRPDQRFLASRAPVLPRAEAETIRTFYGGSEEDWTEVDGFASSEAGDRHFVWNGSTGEIRFGPLIRYPDGSSWQHGAIPPVGAEVTVTSYRYGGGSAGNVGAGTLTVLRSPGGDPGALAGIDRVSNLLPAFGGVDAETVENAKRRLPQQLRRGPKAVTMDDYERLAAEADSSIARVRCLPPGRSGDPIRLLVVPRIDLVPEEQLLDDLALSDVAVTRVAEYLDERRVLGAEVEIGTPYYQGVSVAALIKALPGRPLPLVRERALLALYEYIDPVHGGRRGLGWPFDEPLTAMSLFAFLEGVDGVERVDEVLLFEYDLRNHERLGVGKTAVRLAPDSLFLSANHQVVVT